MSDIVDAPCLGGSLGDRCNCVSVVEHVLPGCKGSLGVITGWGRVGHVAGCGRDDLCVCLEGSLCLVVLVAAAWLQGQRGQVGEPIGNSSEGCELCVGPEGLELLWSVSSSLSAYTKGRRHLSIVEPLE